MQCVRVDYVRRDGTIDRGPSEPRAQGEIRWRDYLWEEERNSGRAPYQEGRHVVYNAGETMRYAHFQYPDRTRSAVLMVYDGDY